MFHSRSGPLQADNVRRHRSKAVALGLVATATSAGVVGTGTAIAHAATPSPTVAATIVYTDGAHPTYKLHVHGAKFSRNGSERVDIRDSSTGQIRRLRPTANRNGAFDVDTTFAWRNCGSPLGKVSIATTQVGNGPAIPPSRVRTTVPALRRRACDTVLLGQSLDPNKSILSANYTPTASSWFGLILQSDGNLVQYQYFRDAATGVITQTPKWATNTTGVNVKSAGLQTDGNFVLYADSGKACFATGTPGYGNPLTMLTVQNDGNIVLYDKDGTPHWSSQAAGSVPNTCP